MNIESKYREKLVIRRKPQFNENVNDEIKHSAEDSFHIEYFLYIVDQSLSSIETRLNNFYNMKLFFIFYLHLKNLKL